VGQHLRLRLGEAEDVGFVLDRQSALVAGVAQPGDEGEKIDAALAQRREGEVGEAAGAILHVHVGDAGPLLRHQAEGILALDEEMAGVEIDPEIAARQVAGKPGIGRHACAHGRMGIAALGPRKNASKPAPEHKIFPYLLRGMTIDRANQVWAADITYIPIGRGFLYLVAVIDWASRAVLAWRLSNTLDTRFCIDALEEALARFGTPEIFNTDQGSQFTSTAFTGRLAAAGIKISMDGRGRWMDNVFIERLWRSLKYEDIYLKGYADGREAKAGIANWISFYNGRRPHQALGNRTPMAVWRDGVTGALGDKAVDMTLRHGRSLDNADALPTGPQRASTPPR